MQLIERAASVLLPSETMLRKHHQRALSLLFWSADSILLTCDPTFLKLPLFLIEPDFFPSIPAADLLLFVKCHGPHLFLGFFFFFFCTQVSGADTCIF